MDKNEMLMNCIAESHNHKILTEAMDTINEFLLDGYEIYLKNSDDTIKLDKPFDNFYEIKITPIYQ